MDRDGALKIFLVRGYNQAVPKPHAIRITKPLGGSSRLEAYIMPLSSRLEPTDAIHFRWCYIDTGDLSHLTMERNFYVITPLTEAELAELIDQLEAKMIALYQQATQPITTETENTTS